MRQQNIRFLVVCGLVLLIGGFSLLLIDSQMIYAQDDDEDLEYVGARECSRCHRNVARDHENTAHGLALQNTEDDQDLILADFDQGEDVRQVQFPGEDAPRAFTADDVAFAVGAGRRVQRYLLEVDRNEYQVLPAEWNTVEGQWQPLNLGEEWPGDAYNWNQNCAGCHTTGLNVERGRWEDDGVQCESCHGPGSLHVELARDDEDFAEIVGAINPGVDPQVCGQCHGAGTGEDGFAFPVGYVPGGDLSAAFTLFPPEDTAHWWVTGHASHKNMQYNEWLLGGHAGSLEGLRESEFADDSCLSCHSADYDYTARLIAAVEEGDRDGDPPAMPSVESAQYGVTCVSCHNPHSDPEEALPANLRQENYALCTSCHSNASIPDGIHHPAQEMYEGAALIDTVPPRPGAHFTAEDGPDCASCHLPEVPVDIGSRASHALEPIMPGEALSAQGLVDGCSSCHAEQAEPAAMQRLIDDVQADTRARIDTARAAVVASTPEWVVRALDFVEGDGSLGVHNYAYADALLDAVFTELGLFAVEPEQ